MLEKLDEELSRIGAAARENGSTAEVEDEIGDLLFVLVNLARFLKVDPEQALRRTNAKFRKRFAHVEKHAALPGATLERDGGAVAGGQGAMIEIRALTEREDLKTAVNLQREIWGFEDIELLPLRLFVVATKIGGQVFGAFDGRRMVGFCLAIPGIKAGGKIYLHSHMLGVLQEYRDAGVGRMLKLAQREDALARGIN